MAKMITIEKTDSTFWLPLTAITSSYHAASTDPTRYYINGVFVEWDEFSGELRTIGTDGHILLKHTTTLDGHLGKGCSSQGGDERRGFILRTDTKDKAFKAKGVNLWVYGDMESGLLQMLDIGRKGAPEDDCTYPRVGVCEFEKIDGTYPDYSRIIPDHAPKHNVMAFNPALLARLHKGARECLGSPTANAPLSMSSQGEGEPMRVHFQSSVPLVGVIMPTRF